MNKNPKIAIVHDYLNAYGGAESLVNSIWELWPDAPIYTALWDQTAFLGTDAFKGADIRVPRWAASRFINRFYKYFTFSFPLVYESFNLRKFNIIISSSANFAKGVLTGPDQLHISYIHTPPRFLYGYPTETAKRDKWYWKPILMPLDSFLRIWDYIAAQRPNFLVCNSGEVKSRIKKFYRRDAVVINPFFSVNKEFEKVPAEKGDYYLVVSRMSRYKNPDKAILACSKLGKNLKVAGSGKEFEKIKEIAKGVSRLARSQGAKGKIDILGFVSEEKKVALYKGCRAFIYLVEHEDFGMAALEPMYFGKPVIVLKQGGFLETVKDGYNGVFVEKPTVESLIGGIKRFEKMEKKVNWEKNCKEFVKKYTKERFQKEFRSFVESSWKEFNKNR